MKHTAYSFIICIAMTLVATTAAAQRQGIVVDAATKVPLRDVSVRFDCGKQQQTQWNGIFSIPDNFDRAAFSHPKYEKCFLKHSELADTVFMLPAAIVLGEVVIYGKKGAKKDFAKLNKTDLKLAGAKADGNLLGLLQLIMNPFTSSSMSKKELQRQKHKQILDNY